MPHFARYIQCHTNAMLLYLDQSEFMRSFRTLYCIRSLSSSPCALRSNSKHIFLCVYAVGRLRSWTCARARSANSEIGRPIKNRLPIGLIIPFYLSSSFAILPLFFSSPHHYQWTRLWISVLVFGFCLLVDAIQTKHSIWSINRCTTEHRNLHTRTEIYFLLR